MGTKKRFLFALVSAVLLSVPWLGVSGIVLPVAFVPLMAISDSYEIGKRGFRRTMGWMALTFGLWAAVTTWWIWYAAAIGAILSVVITWLLFGGVFMAWHWMSKRAPRVLSYTFLVSAWIAAEFLYTNGEVSFPWLTLGNGFANDIALVQWYDTTGVFGGSLWVLVMNVLFFEAYRRRTKVPAVAAGILLIVPVTISLIRYATYNEKGEPVVVTSVQPNIEPYYLRRILPAEEQTQIMLSLASEAPADAGFVIFPESAIYETVIENIIEDDRAVRAFRGFIEEKYPQTQFIVGASTRNYYLPGDKVSQTARFDQREDLYYDYYNTAIELTAGRPADVYHKAKLVVGVEKMPYYSVMKHLEFLIVDLGGVSGQLGVDAERKVFTSPGGVSAGAAICWEGVFGEYYGGFVKKGADIMFIISNDAWWGNTQGYRQLFRLSQLRAIETRRAIARSANTGVSGFIDQRGRTLQKVGWDVRTALTDTIYTNDKITFYTRYGDYVARISVLVFGLCVLYYIAYRVKRRNLLTE